MTNNYIELTCRAWFDNEEDPVETEFYFDPVLHCSSLEELRDIAVKDLSAIAGYNIPAEEIELEIIDYAGVHDKYANEKDVWEYAEVWNNFQYDLDVFHAGIECGIDLGSIEEAYTGKYKDDKDFAYDFAEGIGALNKNQSWPYDCIDWDKAARELMLDYSEHNGYYFRDL